MTLIDLVRSIDGAEEALAERGLEHRGVRYVYGMLVRQPWTLNEKIISNDEARTYVHGLAGNETSRRAQWSEAAPDPAQRIVMVGEHRALIPASIPPEWHYTAACLALIVAAGKEKSNA